MKNSSTKITKELVKHETGSSVAIVITTYKRQTLLSKLLASISDLSDRPEAVIIVDNENSEKTAEIVSEFANRMPKSVVKYCPQTTNTGGAGGFSAGTKVAYETGFDWIWMMDDDVVVLPQALEKIRPILASGDKRWHRVIQPRRVNFDGTNFYWQYHFLTGLGIPNPIAASEFEEDEDYKEMNTACFEGGFFHNSLVREIGAPDHRFFIYWDDTVYGYLASKITNPILVNEFLLARSRTIDNIQIGKARKLNSTSDMVRYFIMRNRGYIAKYLEIYGDYRKFLFGFGTFLTFCKEVIRLFVSRDNSKFSGLKQIIRGMFDARKIYRDETWKPIGPLL